MAIDTGTLNALYKVAYAKGVEDLIPKASKLADMIPFVASELQNGKQYEQPVILAAEQGFTYNLDSEDAYDLNDAVGMSMQSAIVPGNDVILSSLVGYNQAARASHNATSFKSVMSTKFENMLKSTEKRIEIALLYGSTNIAEMATQTAPISGGEVTIQITAGSWATGIFAGSENAQVIFSTQAGAAVDSLRSFKISKVDVDNKQIKVVAGSSGTPGTPATLVTALGAGPTQMHFYGTVASASPLVYKEMAGLKKIVTNTGVLFGIDASVYALWKGNSVSTTGPLTMAKVLSAVSKAVQRGLDSDATVLVNPQTWANMADNLAALRQFDSSYNKKKASNGSEELEYVSQNGVLKIVAYNLVKEGDCFIFPQDKMVRIGARELSLNDPTKPQDEIFFTIPGKAAVGLRAYTNQALFLEAPAQAVYISGIQNT